MNTKGLKPEQIPVRAIHADDLATLRAVLEAHPKLLAMDYDGGLLHVAASEGRVSIMEYLAKAALPVDAVDSSGKRPLHKAASNGHIDAMKWLLEHGAKLNESGDVRSALITPVGDGNFEVVKFLVERGIDVNAEYTDAYGKRRNALFQAVSLGHNAIADYLRQHGAKMPEGLAAGGAGPSSSLLQHVQDKLGPIEPLSLLEIVPGDPPLTVHVVRPSGKRDYLTLFTEGMSARSMPVPADVEEQPAYAEMLIKLPADWPLDMKSLQDPRRFWPIEWLRRLARYPFENGTWIGKGHTLSNGDPPEPVASDTKLSCFLLLPEDVGIGPVPLADGRTVEFLWIIPIYQEEREFMEKKGLIKLMDLFEKRDVPEAIDSARPNVAGGEKGWFGRLRGK